MKSNRRHAESQETTSVLGVGWPPGTAAYARTSRDFTEPPLVFGRPTLPAPGCPLCEIAQELEDLGFAPEASAWAERDLILALVECKPPDEVLDHLRELYGLVVDPDDYEKHRRLHVPALASTQVAAVEDLSAEEFDDKSWREIFDALHLSAAYLRRGLADGSLKPTVSESIQATRLLAEMMSASLEDSEGKGSEQENSLFLMLRVFRDFKDRLEDAIPDEGVREAVSGLVAEISENLVEELDKGREVAPLYPRGRASEEDPENPEDEGDETR